MNSSFIELKGVKKFYDMGEVVIKAADDVSFSIDKGEFVVILGASGAEKSTIGLLSDTSKKYNMTVIIITHNTALAPIADKIITVKNGSIDSVRENQSPTPIERAEW